MCDTRRQIVKKGYRPGEATRAQIPMPRDPGPAAGAPIRRPAEPSRILRPGKSGSANGR